MMYGGDRLVPFRGTQNQILTNFEASHAYFNQEENQQQNSLLENSLEESKGTISSQAAVKQAILFDTQYQSVNKRAHLQRVLQDDQLMKSASSKIDELMQSALKGEEDGQVQILQFTNGKKGS